MDRTPCFNTLAADQNQRQIDAAAARGEAHALLQAELHTAFLRGMAGVTSAVPSYQLTQHGMLPREITSSVADEVVQALDTMECAEALMAVLKDSVCPLVAALRASLAAQYVADNADALAEARGVA